MDRDRHAADKLPCVLFAPERNYGFRVRTRLNFFKVRFHLGRGENYRKWQVRRGSEPPMYIDPDTHRISMSNCVLKNNKKLAREIHLGANKTVCAWILCENFESLESVEDEVSGTPVMFNPRKSPFWTDGSSNLDDTRHPRIESSGRRLYST